MSLIFFFWLQKIFFFNLVYNTFKDFSIFSISHTSTNVKFSFLYLKSPREKSTYILVFTLSGFILLVSLIVLLNFLTYLFIMCWISMNLIILQPWCNWSFNLTPCFTHILFSLRPGFFTIFWHAIVLVSFF